MEGAVVNSLQERTTLVPGGRDLDGRPVVLINIPADAVTPSDISPALKYLLSIFSNETKTRGLTILIDARRGPWKLARSYVRQVNSTFAPEELAQLIALRPDAFWDKQRVENCANAQKDGQAIFIQKSRLGKYIDASQLPGELGGHYIYKHDDWLENRLRVEEFYKDAIIVLKELDDLQQLLESNRNLRASEVDAALNSSIDLANSLKILVHAVVSQGKILLEKVELDNRTRKLDSEFESITTPQDILDTIAKLEATLDRISKKQGVLEDAWRDMEKSFGNAKDFSILGDAVARVTNWILGPAEMLLNAQHRVGYDVASAEDLRKDHEAIELQCWDTYGQYAELIHRIDKLKTAEPSSQLKDLLSQRDFMDFVCRSFATRLERRRNILITSLRFFRLVSEYFDRTGEVFESLVMGNKVDDFSTAGMKLRELLESQQTLDVVERELVKEGEKLSDMLSMPVKDALGREIDVDYEEDIVNVRDILDATTARKNIFSDSVELQKLTLEQVTHINAYEKDVIQAVQWLDDLFQVMLKSHGHVGCTVYEIQAQKDEHQAFQETAKGTYNYGCQLLNASLALRQSCRMSLDDHATLSQKIRNSWQRLLSVSQEQMTRLRVSAVFHRTVEEHCNQLRDLREAVASMPLEDMNKKRARVRKYIGHREKLLVEVGRMVRLGRLLRTRLRETLYFDDMMSDQSNSTDQLQQGEVHTTDENLTAIEAISERLQEVTGLAEELDQALRGAQQDCALLTAPLTTSASSSPGRVSPSLRKIFDGTAAAISEDWYPTSKSPNVDSLRSDDDFVTASECTLPQSRSSSFNTAEECDIYAPWWEHGKHDDVSEDISKEKMVLAVGLPELPLAQSVLKPSPEVPPGKIVHEVTETTHIKVQHSHTMGVSSYVLTSETVRDKKGEGVTRKTDIRESVVTNEEIILPPMAAAESEAIDEEFVDKMKEVSEEHAAWSKYYQHYLTKHTIKGCF